MRIIHGRALYTGKYGNLASVVTAHMFYICCFARSEIIQKNARELGVGRGQFLLGVNGLIALTA